MAWYLPACARRNAKCRRNGSAGLAPYLASVGLKLFCDFGGLDGFHHVFIFGFFAGGAIHKDKPCFVGQALPMLDVIFTSTSAQRSGSLA